MALTPKQESFCQHVASGKPLCDAYRLSYDASNMTNGSVNVEASRMLSDPNITLRVDELKKELADRALWSREDSIKTMVAIINRKAKVDGEELPASQDKDIIAAVKVINDMEGFKAPAKQEISGPAGGPITHNLAPVLTPEEWAKAFGGQS